MGGWATPHGRSRMRVRASMSSRFGQRAGDPEQHRGGDKRRTRREVIETLTSLQTELRTGALLETARSMAPELLRDLLRGGADPAVVSRAGDNVLHALCGAVAQVADPRKPSLVGRLEALFAEVDAPRIAAMAQQRNKAGMAPTHLLAQGLAALTDADLANPATRQRLTAVYAFAATRFPKDAWCMAVDLGEAAEAEQNHLARAVRRLARAVQRRARVKGRIKALWTQAKRAHEAGGAGAVEEEEDEEGGEVGAEGDASAPVEEEEEEEEGGGRFEPESAGSGSDSERDGFESGHSGDEEEEGAGTGGDGSGEAKHAVDGQSHPAVSNMGYQALKEELRRLEGVVQRRRQRCDRLVRSLGRMQCVLWRGASPAHLLLTSRAGRGCVLAPLGGMEGGTEGVAPLPQRALVAAGGAHGGTVLHMASAMGAVVIVQALLATPEGRAALEAASTRDGSTALVAAAAHGRVSCARTLLGAGASVAARDSHRQTALHLAVLAGSAEIVGAVLAAGAVVDAVDNWASTPLMLAVARTVGASDVSYEIVNSLLDTRPNMGLCDAHGRTALHYALAPRSDVTALRGRGGALPERDPVETVSSVCAAEGVAVDAADAFGSTPLHYACALGASTSALLLLARGASITALNSDVNAPLGLAALWQRWQFMVAVIPHAKEAVTLPVWHVTAKGMGGGGSDPPAAAALLGRTTKRVATTLLFEAMLHGFEGAAYLLLEQGYPMSRAVADALRAGAFRRALALATKARRQEDLHCRSEDGSTLLHLVAQAKGRGFDEKWSVPLAHLFLRRGVLEGKTASNGRTALHDAANRGHSKLCGVLLDVEGETSAADRLSRVDAAGATPLALALAQWRVRTALALVRAGAHVNTRSVEGRHSLAHLAVHRGDVGKLAAVLALPGRDPSLTDALGRTALHYAVAKGSVRLARMLLEAGAAAETADLEGVTPFGVLVQTLVRAGRASRSAAELMGLLLRAGASPSTSVDTTWFDYSGDTRAKRPAPEPGSPPPDPRLTRTTLLHTVLRWREEGRVREDAMALLAVACWQGAQPAVADGTGDSALIVAIRANAEASLRVMLGDEETAKDAWAAAPESISSALAAGLGVSPLLGLPGAGVGAEAVTEAVAAPDAKGRSPLHVVVSPMPCGSFENDRLLRLLVARGAPVEAKDAAGKTAMFYAGQQASGVMRAALREVGARAVPTMRRAQSLIASWPPAEVDWEADAAEMLGKLRGEGEGAASVRVPPVFSAFAKERDAAVVVHDGAIFDVLLTKVDLRSGPMGSNDFYHIQLVRLPAKRRHVLLTRWGRVGDVVGQYQQEALRTEGEGRESFAKVFEAKTGMAWAEARADPRQCDPVPGKFRPVQQDRFRALQGNENALALDWERAPATALPKPMAEAMRPLMDVPSLRWSLQSTGLDAARMPLGKMRREALEEARTLLTEMLPMAEELEGSVRGAMAATASPEEAAAAVERQRELREELAWRSERFYELVPHKDGLDNVLEPIATERAVRDKAGLVSNLLDLHVSVRLVLGAMLRQHESNPLDYCFSALNISLEHLAPGADALGDERDMLLSYMDRSSPGLSRRVANVFRLQRKDEGSRMEQWREATNHLLLWHGTRTSNVMSILSQGLRIAPPEAPRSGAKYGRGLYFADTARKSIMYATPVGGSLFLLLAEVAVGNPYLPRKMEYMESAPEGFHSTKARGCKEPVPPGTVKMGNGVAVALGEIAEAEVPEDGMRWCWSREEPGAEGPRKWRAFPDKAWQRVEEAWRKGEQRVEMEWQLRHERVASVIDMVNMVETRTRLQAAWSRNRASKHVVEKRKLPARLYFAEEENEYIVYDESQIRLRYVVQLRE